MFFQGWETVFQTIILSILMYASIVIILRTSGKRTLATFNAFDFLITVTIGSISATTILSKTTTFVDGISAIITLVLLQYIVAKISACSKTFRKIIKAEPTLLYYDGKYIEENLKKMRNLYSLFCKRFHSLLLDCKWRWVHYLSVIQYSNHTAARMGSYY